MPFINGRFYMNPAHGRALERARAADASSNDPAQLQGAHWVTIDGRHVLIQETDTVNGQGNQPTSESERYLAIVVFNETGGLSAGTKKGDGSAENLHDARVAVAEVANRLRQSGRPNQVAPGEGGINTGLLQGLAQGNRDFINSLERLLVSSENGAGGIENHKWSHALPP